MKSKHSIILFTILVMIVVMLTMTTTNAQTSVKEKEAKVKKDPAEKPEKVVDPSKDSDIERQTKEFLNALNAGGGKPMETMTPAEARKVLEGAQTSVKVDLSGVDVSEKTIQQDGQSIKLYIVRPSGQSGVLPVFMFFHGGGWVLGDYPTHQRMVRDLVVYSGAVAVFVEYSRSPEVKYPVAINQAYAATQWVAANGASINVDGKRLAVAGNSVGGNMAAVVAMMAKDKKGPAIKLQVLFWPVTDIDFETSTYTKYATSRFLTKNMMVWFWNNYATQEQRKEIYAAPLRATTAQLKGLPPALVQTAENDVLRHEGEAYARKMNKAGVDVTLIRVEGMIHDYGLLNPLSTIPAVNSALRGAGAEIKNALR
jgi:acetyl esterase